MKKIYFITGASGVGKTTLVSTIEKQYAHRKSWIFLHFDSIEVPSHEKMIKEFGSGENWQRITTNSWIKKLLNDYKSYDVIFFEGQVNPHFIIDGFRHQNFKNYEIILIDTNDEEMRDRLAFRKQEELGYEELA